MSGSVAGGVKAAKTNKLKYGKNFYAEIGRIGGKAKVPKGFALDKDRARKAGKKGGTISRRGKALPKYDPDESLLILDEVDSVETQRSWIDRLFR